MIVNDISLNGLNRTRSEEGRALRAYQDSTGVWTIGYGVTNYDKGIGFKVAAGVTITADQAEWLLLWTMRKNYLPDVFRAFGPGLANVTHPQGAVDGGADMHYNTGGILKSSWPRFLVAGNLAAAKANLESWNKAGGRVLSDLVRRRANEWLEISEENYGVMSGPAGVLVNSAGREVGERGTGGLLTAYPTDPASPTAVGSIKGTGVPVADPAKSSPTESYLSSGSTGEAVTAVQDALTGSGIPTPPTGTYDATTAANVTKFQGAHPNLTADGKVGPATSAALTRSLDLRAKMTKLRNAGAVVTSASAGLWQYVSTNAAEIALMGGAALVVVAVGYVTYAYRNDLSAILNKVRGKVVA